MIKSYTAKQTSVLSYGNDNINIVSGQSYILDDIYASGWTNYLTETTDWQTLEEDIAVELANVVKTYNIVNIKGNKKFTLTLNPTSGQIPANSVIVATVKDLQGNTIDDVTLTNTSAITTSSDFSINLNKPFEIYSLTLNITLPLGTAYVVDISIDDLTDSALSVFQYENSTNDSYVISVVPNLS